MLELRKNISISLLMHFMPVMLQLFQIEALKIDINKQKEIGNIVILS